MDCISFNLLTPTSLHRVASVSTRVEMKLRLLNAKKLLTEAVEKVIRCSEVGIKKLNEMQSIVDLLNYWTEIDGSRRRSKRITVRIHAQDDHMLILSKNPPAPPPRATDLCPVIQKINHGLHLV
jgi:hypothetical protein